MNPILKQIISTIESKVTKGNKTNYKKAVIAGLKIMFDPKTHANMELVKNPEARKNPVETIANGISGLMYTMYLKSKKTMPAEVMVMAGMTLMCHVLDFAETGLGVPVDNDLVAATTKRTIEIMFERLGISPEQLNELVLKNHSAYVNGEDPNQQAEQQPEQQPEQPGGLLPQQQPPEQQPPQ